MTDPTSESTAVTESDVVEVLRSIYDPEIPVNIYDLGLIYRIHFPSDRELHILMTLTAPGCPVAGTFPQTIQYRLMTELDLDDVQVELTFEPPYRPDMMTEEARLELGFM
ncbi:MAG TPA: iron-sulfur cluster assembly protein [Rhodothermales bacterium]|nr:iron-sulfur cluster assembly protein [Rhodothermales bacterium]